MNPAITIRKVTVAIATFRRPDSLDLLIRSIVEQEKSDHISVRIVVVDNDPARSAEEVCRRYSGLVAYRSEPEPGLSAVRNAAVELRGDADAVVFVDDDESADRRWLQALVDAADEFDAGVVAGPVIPIFDSAAPRWIVRQQWFRRAAGPTGSDARWPATNNALVRSELFDKLGRPAFGAAFSLTGGEDADLFDRLRTAGVRMIWADRAVVYERVDPARLTARWIWRRNVRLGNISAIILRRRRSAVVVAVVGMGRIMVGVAALLPVTLITPAKGARLLSHLPRGVGMLGELFGARVIEYKRAD